MDDYKFTCEMCKFKCKYNSGWLDHVSSKKHQQQGTQTVYKCNITNCNYESPSHWNLKIHKMNNHSTKEERASSKYYCNDCDQVFFSPIYFERHNIGKRHLNQVKVNQLNNKLLTPQY